MIAPNKTVELINGWLVLVEMQKYGNTPFIERSHIASYTYYIDENNDYDKYSIAFNTGSQMVKWQLSSAEDLQTVFDDVNDLLLSKIII